MAKPNSIVNIMAKKLNLRVVSFNREIFIDILINFAFASSLDPVLKIKKKSDLKF